MPYLDKKELLQSASKTLFGNIPFAGPALSELFFDYNGRVKQNRLNKFIEILADGFSKESNINLDNIKTEDFNDLFEGVLKRVVITKSEAKLNRFRNILIRELTSPTEQTELVDLYLDLISSLSEEELYVLYEHRQFNKNYEVKKEHLSTLENTLENSIEKRSRQTIIMDRSPLSDSITELQSQIDKLQIILKPLEEKRTPNYHNLSSQKFMFYKQSLYSKGLLIDSGIGGIGVRPFQIMGITEFGTEFIEFIKPSNI